MPIAYNKSSKPNRVIEYIVIHDTGNRGKGANVDSHFNYFNGANRDASADFFVDDHKIGQLNPDLRNYYMWHCGDGHGNYGITNANSIGIEICINSDGNYAQAVSNAVELAVYLLKMFGLGMDRLKRHYDASRKNCPQSMNNNGDWSAWTNFKNQVATLNTNIEEEKKVKYLVVYNNYVDKRNAERLAEYLQCPTLDASQVPNFDYSCVTEPIGVGGGAFNPAVKTVLKGTDRDDTTIAVLKYIKKI